MSRALVQMNSNRTVELLSPAGDLTTALAAFEAGADAVYCGLGDFSARAYATNFSLDDLKNLVRVAHAKGRKVYVTFNTLVDEADLEAAVARLADLAEVGPDALIVQDLGIARLVRRHFPELALHASTQLVAHNLEGVLQLKELGFTRVVLARELSLAEIASIAKRCGGLELECFIHGALCYSVSGLCLFSAMEKDRSGNRGKCAYCCRCAYDVDADKGPRRQDEDPHRSLPFSMKDLRLGEDVRKLVEAGVVSLKIEGRMKSALYVASVTKYYRQILDGEARTARDSRAGSGRVTVADLETVFSRRTTELYLNGGQGGVIDPTSLGHLGTPIGTVKRVTKDREGRSWVRFHTARALERHDGLQFAAERGEKPFGFGISEMRTALSRSNVFEVAAGTDVEILLPDEEGTNLIRPGATVFCSMSNAVKRMFPIPSFRPSDYPGERTLDVTVTLTPEKMTAEARLGAPAREVTSSTERPRTVGGLGDRCVRASLEGTFTPAKDPSRTFGAVEKALSKLGGTDYRLGQLTLNDPDRLFAPASLLNDLRRDLVEQVDEARAKAKAERMERALADDGLRDAASRRVPKTLRLRAGQAVPAGDWDEIVVAISRETDLSALQLQLQLQLQTSTSTSTSLRLALPVYTKELDFNSLRTAVKRFLRAGYAKWEASDLATLRMLRALGVTDLTADWSLYAFNSQALAALAELGVTRFVASPENGADNLAYLAESGYPVACLVQQSTPLFISLTQPAAVPCGDLRVFARDGLWITTKRLPRTFAAPKGVATRVDLSWDPPNEETLT